MTSVALVTVADFEDSDTGQKIRIQGKWEDQQVEFLVADSKDTWTAIVQLSSTESFFSVYLSDLELTLDEYVKTMKSTLTGQVSATDSFKIGFSEGQLTWSKKMGEIIIEYGKIAFDRVNLAEKDSLIFSILGIYKDVLADLDNTKIQLQGVTEENTRLSSSFEACIRDKNEMEKELYVKFAAVLNEKKKYIAKIIGKESSSSNIEPVPGPSTL